MIKYWSRFLGFGVNSCNRSAIGFGTTLAIYMGRAQTAMAHSGLQQELFMRIVSIFVSIGLVACGGEPEVVAASSTSTSTSSLQSQPSTSPLESQDEGSGDSIAEIEQEEQLAAMLEPAEVELEGEQEPSDPTTTIRVRAGESFVTLASHSGVTATELAEINGISVREPLFAGQELEIPVWGEQLTQFDESRGARESRRLERYIESKGGLISVAPHAMAYGDTVWGVAVQDAGLPFWVVELFNRDSDLNSLGIGDEIYLPILGDSVTGIEPSEGVALVEPNVEAGE